MAAAYPKFWFVYLLCCRDGTMYSGCTDNLLRRLTAHNTGRGARYTRARLPVRLVYWVRRQGRARAQSYEAQLKRLPRKEKLALVAAHAKPHPPLKGGARA